MLYFLVWVLSEHNVAAKRRKASHPRINQCFCSKPKQNYFAVTLSESVNASSSDCKGCFDSVEQKEQHSTVTISKSSSISANRQSATSNNETF